MRFFRKVTRFILPGAFVIFLSACGGGGGGSTSPPPPTVKTGTATSISTGNATINGTVNPNGQATTAWLEWGSDTALSSFIATPAQNIGSGTAAEAVSAAIDNLASGTKYYFRVAATNASGTLKSAIANFTTGTPNSPPTVTTNAANNVTVSGATVHGSINPNELDTTGWFEYGTDAGLATFDTTAGQSLGAGKISVDIEQSLPLSAATTYYFRVAAQNAIATEKGSIESFTTIAQPPTVTTQTAISVGSDSATLRGSVTPNGLETVAWFEWGADNTLSTFTTTGFQSVGSATTPQSFSQLLQPPLLSGTKYYFRIAARNSASPDASKGGIVEFDTSTVPPTATTVSADTISSASARLIGTVNPNGVDTTAWFEYGTSPTLGSFTSTDNQMLGNGRTDVSINAVPNLSAGTTYYFRVAAQSTAGPLPIKGSILPFTTLLSPTVTTNPATFNSATSGVLKGDGNPNGYATTAWFEYGTDPALTSFSTTSAQNLGSGLSTVHFSATVSLSLYQTYYFRAAATNSGGTEKGAIRSFQTGVRYVAVGDSITAGSHDDIASDGTGYEPILGTLLLNNPYTVANEGVSGTTSADGAAFINSTLSAYPNANYYLILYGTNDASISVSKATYKANMQTIIDRIKAGGKIPFLAKVPFATASGFSDASIRDYNTAIDELVADPLNGISVVPPDFYTWFQSHQSQLADGIHPNGTGYQSMATLWFNALP